MTRAVSDSLAKRPRTAAKHLDASGDTWLVQYTHMFMINGQI